MLSKKERIVPPLAPLGVLVWLLAAVAHSANESPDIEVSTKLESDMRSPPDIMSRRSSENASRTNMVPGEG